MWRWLCDWVFLTNLRVRWEEHQRKDELLSEKWRRVWMR